MKNQENIESSQVIGSYGYYQKGNRYHWMINDEIKTEMGFRTKKECDVWIDEKRNQYGFQWRAGYMVKFKCEQTHWCLVNKKGVDIKTI